MNKCELKNILLQLFIIGYEGIKPPEVFVELIKHGLGGVIFFAENLKFRSEFKKEIQKLKKISSIPLFLSIDQEGGLVERTLFLDKKNEYLTPYSLNKLPVKDVKLHYELLANDLTDLGLNLNFAPVLDVNTNPLNPIINVRAFGDNPKIVTKYTNAVIKTFKKNNIISCGKHFAGHGDTSVDSHSNMPFVDMNFNDFYKQHLICFEKAIKSGVDTIMVSHVHFSFFDKQKCPASLSKNAIDYLKDDLKFEGIIFSDDMVMGGISKNYGLKESIILGLNAGIHSLIFRNITKELLIAIDEIVETALTDTKLQNIIINNYKKIIEFKKEKIKNTKSKNFSLSKNQKIIDKMAEKTVRVIKKSNLLPLNKKQNIKIISFNSKDIFNLSNNKKQVIDFLHGYNIEEINYPLNPANEDIKKVSSKINNDDTVIFFSYNAQINKGQIELFDKINTDKILVSCASDCDIKLFKGAKSIISLRCYKTPSLSALAKKLKDK